MAPWMYISVCIISAFVFHTVTGANFQVSPTQINIGGPEPTTSLSLVCSPSALGITEIFFIEIGKVTQSVPNPDAAIAIVTSSGTSVSDASLQQRMTVTGSTDLGGNLDIELRDLRCSDEATYYCKTSYLAGSSGENRATVNVTVRTYPGEISMFVEPNLEAYSQTPMLVTFTCTGQVGNQVQDVNNLWRWETRQLDVFTTRWERYENEANITRPTPTSAGNCQYDGRTTLTHTVTSADNRKQFRCSVVNDQYSANKTVNTEAPVTSGPGNPGGVASAGSPDLGLILGILFGVLAVIVIVVVLVYFLVFRRKSGGDDYETGEGKDDRPPMTDNVVYSTPASRDNKASRMKGRENDAMDEPQEKNPRRYYANDYADHGRSNPAMDHSKHDDSYDDDNTDSRTRSPYGSAV